MGEVKDNNVAPIWRITLSVHRGCDVYMNCPLCGPSDSLASDIILKRHRT